MQCIPKMVRFAHILFNINKRTGLRNKCENLIKGSHIHPHILTSFLDGLKGSGPLSISEG